MKAIVNLLIITQIFNATAISIKVSSIIVTMTPSSASSTLDSTASKQSPTVNAIVKVVYQRFFSLAIIVDFISGLILDIILSVFVVLYRHRRRRLAGEARNGGEGKNSELDSQSTIVSKPISHSANNAFRIDFLRQEFKSPKRSSRVKSFFFKPSSLRSPDGIERS